MDTEKLKHAGGRPLKYASVEDFESDAATYFKETPQEQWTITGLAVSLNTSRATLMNYENRDEFFDAIKAVKDKVEMAYELSLRSRGGAGDIFGLKNFGWRDRFDNVNENENNNTNLDATQLTDEELIGKLKAIRAS